MKALQETYRQLINHTLPQAISWPVRNNHCFARIILDWTFAGCWYNYLHKNAPAYKQLTAQQLTAAINHMQLWLCDTAVLVADNNASLGYRKAPDKPANAVNASLSNK